MLAELKEYTVEVDVDFVNLAIEAIGNVAMLVPSSARSCVEMLEGFLKRRNPSMMDSTAVSLSKIIRRYPGQFTEAIRSICMVSDLLESSTSRAALVWLIGEHAAAIDNAPGVMTTFLSTMNDEMPSVQQQILVAVVKCSLAFNAPSSEMMVNAIKFCRESDNVDLRDRAVMFERMCQHPEEAKKIVGGPRPPIAVDRGIQEPLLSQYLGCLGSVAAVEYQPLESFNGASGGSGAASGGFGQTSQDLLIMDEDTGLDKLSSGPLAIDAAANHPPSDTAGQKGGENGLSFLDDLLGDGLSV
eukprot:Plantae.Rhodophyta-Hildenbrandia_rubra.ctg776.p2 GENE.Plantae.Rhodophyta-Hildenbrandia_rubra.ctg776~~Plantae.Rhodophyta-Hildenbrandia_rubra.ctg776.p2  ORF type:complete len:300 (-),score=59.30 Plantae.Rhodophyta-Hildenbrandia_rubra.ctg776:600-1499(-)